MQFRVRATGQEISDADMRQRFPKKSLPAVIDSSTADLLNVDIIEETVSPKLRIGQTAYPGPAVKNSEGVWTRTWVVETLESEQVQAELKNIQEQKLFELDARRKQKLTDGFVTVRVNTKTTEDVTPAWTVEPYEVEFTTTLLDRARYEVLLYSARNAMYDGKHLEDFLDSSAGLEFYLSRNGEPVALKLKTVFQIVDALRVHDSLIDRQYLKHRKIILASEDPREYDLYSNW